MVGFAKGQGSMGWALEYGSGIRLWNIGWPVVLHENERREGREGCERDFRKCPHISGGLSQCSALLPHGDGSALTPCRVWIPIPHRESPVPAFPAQGQPGRAPG